MARRHPSPSADALKVSGSPRPGWQFRHDEASESLRKQFGVKTLAGFGLAEASPAIPAAGAVVGISLKHKR